MTTNLTLRQSLAMRLREVRIDCFGEGEEEMFTLAEVLDLPPGTWRNFEHGVVMPADLLLKLIEATRVNPHWLLTGNGERYATDFGLRFSSKH